MICTLLTIPLHNSLIREGLIVEIRTFGYNTRLKISERKPELNVGEIALPNVHSGCGVHDEYAVEKGANSTGCWFDLGWAI